MIELKEKIIASMFLHSYFDTLGFNNGQWEFDFKMEVKDMKDSGYAWLNIVHHFFALGGFSNIDISKWNASDDTIMNIASAKACLKGGTRQDYFDEYMKVKKELLEDKRLTGMVTSIKLSTLKKSKELDKVAYDEYNGGSGGSMRTCSIGLIYYKEDDLDKLIENSIVATRITHNYYMGFLGGFVSALFTSFAVRNIEPWLWVDKMLDIYKSGKIDNYMKTTDVYKEYKEDKDKFFDAWEDYREKRLKKFKMKPFEFIHFPDRFKSLEKYNRFDHGMCQFFGASGLSSCIVAYDSLLCSIISHKKPMDLKNVKYSTDSFIFFSCLHFGDNDTTGAIGGAWYGALRGFTDFDIKKVKDLEFSKELENISKKICEKIL